MALKIQLRRGTASEWTTANPVLMQGEMGVETDTLKVKLGDGTTAWTSLQYFTQGVKGDTGATGATGATGPRGLKGDVGDTGPANTLTVGTVTTGAAGTDAVVTIAGDAPNQTISFTIPKGDQGIQGIQGIQGPTGATGPANSLSIGTVSSGVSAAATITGTAPSQTLNLTLPKGDTGSTGATGATGPAGLGVPAGGSTGQVLAKTSGADNATAWVTPGQSPNYVVNGGYDIWQRGTNVTVPSAYGFIADRWFAYSYGTSTLNAQRIAFSNDRISELAVPYFMRIVSTDSRTLIGTRIEGVETLAGSTGTVSFWAKASSSISLNVYISQMFGSGGSDETYAVDQNVSVTTSWQRFRVTGNFPSISGKTIGDGNYLKIQLATAFGTYGQTIDIAGVQLEQGVIATPFRRAANTVQGELAACMRYYQPKRTVYMAATSGGFGANAYFSYIYPVPMRTAPTLTFYSLTASTAGKVSLYVSGAESLSNNINLDYASPYSFAGYGQNNAWNTTANGALLAYQLEMSAEL